MIMNLLDWFEKLRTGNYAGRRKGKGEGLETQPCAQDKEAVLERSWILEEDSITRTKQVAV